MRSLIRIYLVILVFLVFAQARASIATSKDYGQIQDFLVDLARSYPQTTSLIEIGQNSQGQAILGVKIGDGSVKNLIVATHHGNEYGSTDVAIAAAREFAKRPVIGRTIFIVPVLNISGFNKGSRGEFIDPNDIFTVDPNRDYPGPCGSEGPYRLRSTRALADFIQSEGIVTSATLHTSGSMILLPWGVPSTHTTTNHDEQFFALGKMCTAANRYRVGHSTDLLYPTKGSFEDFAYWQHGIWSILIEIGRLREPDEVTMKINLRETLPGLRAVMANGPSERAKNSEFRGLCSRKSKMIDLRDE